MEKIIYPKLQKKFIEFKQKYQHMYSPDEWEYIEENFFNDISSPYPPNQMMQIYGKLNINTKSSDFYNRHLSLIRSIFPIDGNIIEIGSGNFPIFAENLAKEQLTIGKGTVTLFEPLLMDMTPKYHNMTLHKEEFTLDTDVSKADLLVGIHPCKATKTILESAIRNYKDFYIAMCGCDHSPGAEYMDFMDQYPEDFQQDIIYEAKRLLKEYPNGELEVTRLKNHPLPYPILYNKHR